MSTDATDSLRKQRREGLARILCARSIVFVGGSACEPAINYCRALGYSGQLFVVSPTRTEIAEIKCVRDFDDLPLIPDVAWIALRPEDTIATVERLAQIGVAGAVCFGAGYAEVGQPELQERLVKAAGNMALLGPNTTGFVNFVDRLAVMVESHGTAVPERGIAVISQSGTFGANLALSNRQVPVSHIVSLGNQACVDTADVLETLCDDPRVACFALYVEGIADPTAFADAAARAFEAGKPVLCLHAGNSTAGRELVVSHTAALSGTPDAFGAFYRRLGVLQVPSFPVLMETAKLFVAGRAPAGRRLVIETASGMDSIYCADLAQAHGVVLPPPSAPSKRALQDLLPDIATLANPLDVTMAMWGDREAQAEALVALSRTPCDMAALVVNAPSTTQVDSFFPAFLAAARAQSTLDVPCYVMTNLPEGLPQQVTADLRNAGCIVLQGLEDGFAALDLACRYAEYSNQLKQEGGPDRRLLAACPDTTRQTKTLSETDSKSVLAAAGVPVPVSASRHSIECAVQDAHAIGYPVVLKAVGAALHHKTEVGGVELGLDDEVAVRQAALRLLQIEGVETLLVEEMISDAVAEVIVGITRDPILGLKLTIGAGGTLAELLEDVSTLILPTSRREIERAIKRLRIFRLIAGWRGMPEGDFDALVGLVEKVCSFAESCAETIVELDLNPVLVRPKNCGAVAVDALLVRVDAP